MSRGSLAGTGAVATSDPRATEAGAAVLRAGGNCVDAAVAAALVLFVVEPHHCGPGGDAFLLVRVPGSDTPEALDGAGSVPAGLSSAALRRDDLSEVPAFGARSVSVPGAVALLHEALATYGSLEFDDAAVHAFHLAREGFTVRPTLASAIDGCLARISRDPVLAPLYAADGRGREAGERMTNPALAEALFDLGRGGPDAFYHGAIADDIVRTVAAGGGYLSADDLAGHRTVAAVPQVTSFRGHEVWQLPEPTPGAAVLVALDRLAGMELADWPAVVEATRAGLAHVGIDLSAPAGPVSSGTSHIAVVDASGGAASLITSVLTDFGSGVGVESLGSPLHNRAAGFRMVQQDPRPGKPPHTLIPALVTRDADEVVALGVAGGPMQPQGQVQILVRLLVEGMEAQDAIDAPRFRLVPGGHVALEAGHPLESEHPAGVGREPGMGGFGSAQFAASDGTTTMAAADRRRGGAATVVPVG